MAHTEQTTEHETGMKMRCPMCGAEFKAHELDEHRRETHPNE